MRRSIRSLAMVVLRACFRTAPPRDHGGRVRWLRRKAFQVAARVPPGYFSQKGQDYRVAELLGRRRAGFFVDVGAFDGVTGSNTCYFERALGWSGVCIEPNPDRFAELRRARRAKARCVAVSREAGRVPFLKVPGAWAQLSGVETTLRRRKLERARAEVGKGFESIEVDSLPLCTILAEEGVGDIDLLSVDVEGAEIEVLRSHDFERFPTHVICVENSRSDNQIERLLRRKGFRLEMTIGREEEIYVRRSWPAEGSAGS